MLRRARPNLAGIETRAGKVDVTHAAGPPCQLDLPRAKSSRLFISTPAKDLFFYFFSVSVSF